MDFLTYDYYLLMIIMTEETGHNTMENIPKIGIFSQQF